MNEKNKLSWNLGAAKYSAKFHAPEILRRIDAQPETAFHPAMWAMLASRVPDFSGLRVCVPSSGDNHAVFAFARLGATVTSCDIAENQLENARRAASQFEWAERIVFRCEDTMALAGVEDGAYDLVYTSNGVHVWISGLDAMYTNIARALKPGGAYMMYEIHPFQRPFDDNARVIKPYDMTGPFEDEQEINYHWRLMDILNAITGAGLTIARIDEAFAQKDYDAPFWLNLDELLNGAKATREQVDAMHDWRVNPMAALPNFLCLRAEKI